MSQSAECNDPSEPKVATLQARFKFGRAPAGVKPLIGICTITDHL
jgi:hypothetical protein